MTALALLVWNCAGGFRQKSHVVTRAAPDIAVISEIAAKDLDVFGEAASVAAIGTGAGPFGLAVFCFNGWKIQAVDTPVDEHLFLPVVASRGDERVQVVGACVKKARDRYVAPTLRALRALEQFIRSSPTIVAGDFNQSAVYDRTRRYGPGRRFSDVVTAFQGLGMKSAWHDQRHEPFGSESAPTHFYLKTKTMWHIDYAFVPRDVEVISADMGSFDEIITGKISDHLPLNFVLRGIG